MPIDSICLVTASGPARASRTLAKLFTAAGLRAEVTGVAEWPAWVRPDPAQVVVVDGALLAGTDWPMLRVRLAESGRFFVVVHADTGSAPIVESLRDGAYEAVTLADPPERLRAAVQGTGEAEALWRRLYGEADRDAVARWLTGVSPALVSLRETIRRIGPTSASVLVTGESGTGKERVAQALHAARARGPFVAINCAAIPRDLLEAELFGAAKGAFTGATADRPGLVEQANGGTLFLDEIGEMDPALQPKLLRFLETRRARRVGARTEYAVEVRVVAATNADLLRRIERGAFREDLFYRLAEFTLALPPLRQHREDIPALVRLFLDDAAGRHGKVVSGIEPALLRKLQEWDWPGNARELRNAVERLVILANGPVLGAGAWERPGPAAAPRAAAAPAPPPAPRPAGSVPADISPVGLNRRQKRELAFRLLDESQGDLAWVAARLAVHPTTLYRWRRKAGKV
jgi:DNA-binding NtrC family response regulator